MNSNKIFAIVAAVVVVIVAVIAYMQFNKPVATDSSARSTADTTVNNSSNNSTNNSVSTNTPKDQITQGCPSGQDVTATDANGRFKPTIDIANKTAVLETSMGKIAIQLYDKDAPKTVENFVCLIQSGYYNGIVFHRVSHGFVIQAGDPNGNGTGGKSVYGQDFEDELYADTPSYQAGYLKGVVAMANRGPHTNGSQFFIMTADHLDLPHNYTIFGKVSAGMDVVTKIGNVAITPGMSPEDGTPKTPITITKATVQ